MTERPLEKGDYVLATKYSDGDPCDHFVVGFFDRMLGDDRFIVVDGDGVPFRASGFRRCERISQNVGGTIVAALRAGVIGDQPGRSVWYWRRNPRKLKELTDALAKEVDREPA